jgi:hypothetical protein
MRDDVINRAALRDLIFRQAPEPGYMCQSDFTDADGLGIAPGVWPFSWQGWF